MSRVSVAPQCAGLGRARPRVTSRLFGRLVAEGGDRSSAGHLAPCSVVGPGRGATSTPARSIRWRRRLGPTREKRDALRDDAICWGRCASGVDAKSGDAELARLVDEALGDPCAGEGNEARRQQLEQLVVAPKGSCAAVGVPVGPEHHLMDRVVLGPAGGRWPCTAEGVFGWGEPRRLIEEGSPPDRAVRARQNRGSRRCRSNRRRSRSAAGHGPDSASMW